MLCLRFWAGQVGIALQHPARADGDLCLSHTRRASGLSSLTYTCASRMPDLLDYLASWPLESR